MHDTLPALYRLITRWDGFFACFLLSSLPALGQRSAELAPLSPTSRDSISALTLRPTSASWLDGEISQRLQLGLLTEEAGEQLRASYQELLLHPLDINEATESDLQQLPFLSDYQIYQLLSYRTDHGGFHTVSELKLVRGWTVTLLQHLRPLLRCEVREERLSWQASQLRSRSTLLMLYGRETKHPDWLGAGDQGRLQIGIDYPDRLHLFFAGEKDAGERWQDGGRPGFDAYNFTAELPLRQGKLLLGDYRVTRGCGLLLGQGIFPLAFRSLTPRLPEGIRPLRHSSEQGFSRGIAGELRGQRWEMGFFAASQRLDARRQADGLLLGLSTTGLHRTKAEREARHGGRTRYAGGWLTLLPHPSLRLSLQLVHQDWLGDRLSTPPGSHRQEELRGLGRYTAGSFSYRWIGARGKIQLQGELARTDRRAWAMIQHLTLQQQSWGDLHLSLWHIGRGYWTDFGRAGTHGLQPSDEQGSRLQYQFTPRRYLGTTLLFVDGYRSLSQHPSREALRHGWSWGILTSLELKHEDQFIWSYRLSASQQTARTHRLRLQYVFERGGWQSRLSLLCSQPVGGTRGWALLGESTGELAQRLQLRALAGYFDARSWSSRLYSSLPQLTSQHGSLLLFGRGAVISMRLRYQPQRPWSIALAGYHIAQQAPGNRPPHRTSLALELIYHML